MTSGIPNRCSNFEMWKSARVRCQGTIKQRRDNNWENARKQNPRREFITTIIINNYHGGIIYSAVMRTAILWEAVCNIVMAVTEATLGFRRDFLSEKGGKCDVSVPTWPHEIYGNFRIYYWWFIFYFIYIGTQVRGYESILKHCGYYYDSGTEPITTIST